MATLGSVFLGFECPDRGRRVQGGPAAVARDRLRRPWPRQPLTWFWGLRGGRGRVGDIRQQLPATGHFTRTGYDHSSSQ